MNELMRKLIKRQFERKIRDDYESGTPIKYIAVKNNKTPEEIEEIIKNDR